MAYRKSLIRGPRLLLVSSLQQTDGRQRVTDVSLNKQYTNVQKVDSQAEPTFEIRLVFKARLLFEARLLLVQSGQTTACIRGFMVNETQPKRFL